MLDLFKKVGNIAAYTESFTHDNSIEVSFINGTSIVAKETYYNTTIEKAINDLFSKKLDIHTEKFVHEIFLESYSKNTFSTSDMDWFCRIDDTKYFIHFYKSENEFIKDKYGLRIIDR